MIPSCLLNPSKVTTIVFGQYNIELKKGKELTLESNLGNHLMFESVTATDGILHHLSVSFDELYSVILECNDDMPLDPEIDHRLKMAWECRFFPAKDVNAVEGDEFQMLPKVPILPCLLEIRDLLKPVSSINQSRMLGLFLDRFGDRIIPSECDSHWTALINDAKVLTSKQRLEVFKSGLFSIGMGATNSGSDALDFAIDSGDPWLIRAAKAFEKSQHSSSRMEEEMAQRHHRWAAQGSHFVRKYIAGKREGQTCLKLLRDALMDLISDRGDFTSVDLMGMVWHSSDENRAAVLRKLMLAMQNTLDYHTVHSDKTGWFWARQVVMEHPLWLSDDGGSVLFERVVAQVDAEVESKAGSEIRDAFEKLTQTEPSMWRSLVSFSVSDASGIVRQDEIDGATLPRLSEAEMDRLTRETNSLDFNVRKECDSKAYMTDLLLTAHLVDAHFKRLMREALAPLGKVQFGPVKQGSRVEPKSEEYAKEGRRWPHSACVIDLVRCSLTVSTLSEMVQACQALVKFVRAHSEHLSICRCKNGFARYSASIPTSYTDVKFNLACKSGDGSRAIIGEVQILLDCVLKAKLKAHELYEVSRSRPLFIGAAHRLHNQLSFSQQLILTGGDQRLLVRPLALTPFLFRPHFDGEILSSMSMLSLLLRAELKSGSLVADLATALVNRSNADQSDRIMDALVQSLSAFKGGAGCFGKGSGALMTAIAQRIAELRSEDHSALVAMLYSRMTDQMTDLGLDMGHCFHLFIELDYSVKSQLEWKDCLEVREFSFIPKSFAFLSQLFRGFSKVGGLLTFLQHSRPQLFDVFDESNPRVLATEMQSILDEMLTVDHNVGPMNSSWVPIICLLDLKLACRILSPNISSIAGYLRTLVSERSLSAVCDWLDSVRPELAKRVFCEREAVGLLPGSILTSAKKEDCLRIQVYNPTVQVIHQWSKSDGYGSEWSKTRFLFPEPLLLSGMKSEVVTKVMSDEFTDYFGDQRSEECKFAIWEWSVGYFAVKACARGSDSKEFIKLLPNPEWPFFQAWLDEHIAEFKISEQKYFSKVSESMSDVNKAGSVEEYREWKKDRPLLLKDFPLHCYLGVIGDCVNLTRRVISGFAAELDCEHMDLAMILKVDWIDQDAVSEMAAHIHQQCQFGSSDELREWMVSNMARWMVSIRFGIQSGTLLSRVFQLADESQSSSDEHKSEHSEDDPSWAAQCAAFIAGLLQVCPKEQTRLFALSELLISLPDSVIARLPDSVISSLTADPPFSELPPSYLTNVSNVVRRLKISNRRLIVDVMQPMFSNHWSFPYRQKVNPTQEYLEPWQYLLTLIHKFDYRLLKIQNPTLDVLFNQMRDAESKSSEDYSLLMAALTQFEKMNLDKSQPKSALGDAYLARVFDR